MDTTCVLIGRRFMIGEPQRRRGVPGNGTSGGRLRAARVSQKTLHKCPSAPVPRRTGLPIWRQVYLRLAARRTFRVKHRPRRYAVMSESSAGGFAWWDGLRRAGILRARPWPW